MAGDRFRREARSWRQRTRNVWRCAQRRECSGCTWAVHLRVHRMAMGMRSWAFSEARSAEGSEGACARETHTAHRTGAVEQRISDERQQLTRVCTIRELVAGTAAAPCACSSRRRWYPAIANTVVRVDGLKLARRAQRTPRACCRGPHRA